MSNFQPATPHNVLVEGFDDGLDGNRGGDDTFHNNNLSGELNANDARGRLSSIGAWLEILASLLLIAASYGLVGAIPQLSANSGFLTAILFIIPALLIVAITGERNGDPSLSRLSVATVFAITSVICVGFSIYQGGLKENVWPTAIALAGAITFWSLMRLTGESVLRSISFGSVIAAILFISFGATSEAFHGFFRRLANWFVAMFFDLASITYVESETGLRVVRGSISILGDSNSYAGAIGLFGLVLALSLLLKQSLSLTLASAFSAAAWWSIFRGLVCLSAVQNDQLNGVWEAAPMSFIAWTFLIVLTALTQIFISAFFASIPLDEYNIEHPLIAQLYNMVVNFPQTGPRSRKLFAPNQQPENKEWESPNDGTSSGLVSSENQSRSLDEKTAPQGDDWEPIVTASEDFVRKATSNTKP